MYELSRWPRGVRRRSEAEERQKTRVTEDKKRDGRGRREESVSERQVKEMDPRWAGGERYGRAANRRTSLPIQIHNCDQSPGPAPFLYIHYLSVWNSSVMTGASTHCSALLSSPGRPRHSTSSTRCKYNTALARRADTSCHLLPLRATSSLGAGA